MKNSDLHFVTLQIWYAASVICSCSNTPACLVFALACLVMGVWQTFSFKAAKNKEAERYRLDAKLLSGLMTPKD